MRLRILRHSVCSGWRTTWVSKYHLASPVTCGLRENAMDKLIQVSPCGYISPYKLMGIRKAICLLLIFVFLGSRSLLDPKNAHSIKPVPRVSQPVSSWPPLSSQCLLRLRVHVCPRLLCLHQKCPGTSPGREEEFMLWDKQSSSPKPISEFITLSRILGKPILVSSSTKWGSWARSSFIDF